MFFLYRIHFQIIGTLVEIAMPQNGIYSPGFIALSEAFKNNPHLKILNFNDNTMREKGAVALAEALPHLQKLETLNLGDCLLKTDGAKLIAKALATKHTNLQVISALIIRLNDILCSFRNIWPGDDKNLNQYNISVFFQFIRQ